MTRPAGSLARDRVSAIVDTLPTPRRQEDEMPILPEDTEEAINVLGDVAEAVRQAEASLEAATEMRRRAFSEAIERPDITMTRVAARTGIPRQYLYELANPEPRRARQRVTARKRG